MTSHSSLFIIVLFIRMLELIIQNYSYLVKYEPMYLLNIDLLVSYISGQ